MRHASVAARRSATSTKRRRRWDASRLSGIIVSLLIFDSLSVSRGVENGTNHAQTVPKPSPPRSPHPPPPAPVPVPAPVPDPKQFFPPPTQRAWNCNIAQGVWVRSSKLPMYNGRSCPHIRASHNCELHGRTNLDYQRLRWRPRGCPIQSLTPMRLVRLFQNKLVLVFGDSVSRNLADSIKCTLYTATPKSLNKIRIANGKTRVTGTWIPRYNIRFASLFSTHLSKASSLPGQPRAADLAALQMPDSTGSSGNLEGSGSPGSLGSSGSMERIERIETTKNQQTSMIHLDQLDSRIIDLLPLADIVIFQATNWWYSTTNQYYLKNRRVNLTRIAAYAIGLKTLRNYVGYMALRAARGLKGFKGKAVLLGASPSHYSTPVPGVKPGTCEVDSKMTWPQTQLFRREDDKTNAFRDVQRRVLQGSAIRYIDVGPMSDWRPDGHLQNWIPDRAASQKNDCLHWCEAGVTDAWLEMVHNTLLF